MLHIYTGREDIDKQRWMFARIQEQDIAAERKRTIFLIVPDQFTLETERSAFTYMNVSAFINPVVLSMNRLAGKLLAEAGENTDYIDRYGKYMLLSRLLYRNKDRLELYRNLENSTTFISQLSEAIMSFKTHLITPEALAVCAEEAQKDGAYGVLLGKKLRDIATLYTEYEEALSGGVPDSTDVTLRFAGLIPESGLLKNAIVWIDGYDYFSPLHLHAIGAMAAHAEEVNVVLTAEAGNPFFALTNGMAEALEEAAGKKRAKTDFLSIANDAAERGICCGYLPEDEKPPEILHIERSLFAGPVRPYIGSGMTATKDSGQAKEKIGGVTPYTGSGMTVTKDPADMRPTEVSAQSYIGSGTIAAKDPEKIIKHIENEDTDTGSSMKGTDGPALRFVVAGDHYSEAEAAAQTIIRLIRDEGFRYRDILVVCNDQDRRAAAIRRVFSDYGIETFLDKRHDAGYNPVLAYITALPEIITRGRRAEDVLRWIGTGLTDVCEEDAEELENYAERYGLSGGAWQKPLIRGANAYDEEAFERISNTVKYAGDMIARFAGRFGTGGADSIESTYARTEGLKKFLEEDARLPEKVIAYADRLEAEGFLEYAARMRGVWDAALGIFVQIGAAFGELATSAEEYATMLRVGFSSVMMGVLPASSDCVTIGTMQRTRTGRVKAMFVLGANDGELPLFAEEEGLLDDTEKETLEKLKLTAFRREENLHLEEQLAIYKNLSKPTHILYLSYTAFSADKQTDKKPSRIFDRLRIMFPDIPLEKDSKLIKKQERRLRISRFEAGSYMLGAERMKALIPPVISPTSIEKYSRCPFSFLMDKGLKLGEFRKHEIDARGIGDVYHEALKRFGENMNKKGGPVNEGSAWNTASRPDTDFIVDEIFREIESDARALGGFEEAGLQGKPDIQISAEGALLFDRENPAASYRRRRLQSIVRDVCWVLTGRARDSGVQRMLFEADFGMGGDFKEIRVEGEVSGSGLRIAGRIDRIDILPDGRARVLDYKSGYEKFSAANIKNGWQLQLMLYLKAIENDFEPAGASYFRIFEPSIDLSDPKTPADPDGIQEAVMDLYRSDGVIAEVSAEADEKQYSEGEKILTRAEFAALRAEAGKRISEIAAGLDAGRIPAAPLQKTGGEHVTACTWCNYQCICNFEAI